PYKVAVGIRSQRDENIFEGGGDGANVRRLRIERELIEETRFGQMLVGLEVDGLTKECGVADTLEFSEMGKNVGGGGGFQFEAPRAGWIDGREKLEIVGFSTDEQARVVDIADVGAAFGLVHVMGR